MTSRRKTVRKEKYRPAVAKWMTAIGLTALSIILNTIPAHTADKLDPFKASFELVRTRTPRIFDIAVNLDFSIHNSIDGKLNGSKFLCNEDIDSLTVTDTFGKRLLYTVKAYPRKRLIWEYPPPVNGVRRVKISFMIRDAVKQKNNRYIVNIDWLGGWKRPVLNASYTLTLPPEFERKHIISTVPPDFKTHSLENGILIRHNLKDARTKGYKITLKAPSGMSRQKSTAVKKPQKKPAPGQNSQKIPPRETVLNRIRYAPHSKKSERIIFEFSSAMPYEMVHNKKAKQIELIWKKQLTAKKDLLKGKEINTGFIESYRWKKVRNTPLRSIIDLKKENLRVRYGTLKNPHRVYLDISSEAQPHKKASAEKNHKTKTAAEPNNKKPESTVTITPKIKPENKEFIDTSDLPKEKIPVSMSIPNKIPIEEKIHYKNATKTFNSGNYRQAVNAYQELLQKFPQTALKENILYRIADAEYQIAETTAGTGYDKALNAYSDAILKYPDAKNAPFAEFRICECMRKDKLWTEAVLQYTTFLKKHPSAESAPVAKYWIAELNYRLKKYKKALAGFKTYVKKYPGGTFIKQASFRIGDCHLKLNDFDRAEYFYEKAFRKWPDMSWLQPADLNNIAITYYYKGRFADSRKLFMQSFNQFPEQENRDMLLRYCADTYQWEGNMQKALDLYGLQLELFPESHEAKLSIMRIADIGVNVSGLDAGNCYYKGLNPYNDPESAYRWLLENDLSEKTWTEAYYKIGFMNAQKGNYKTALGYFKKSMNREPEGIYHKKSIENITKMLVNLINQAADQEDHVQVIDLYAKNEALFLKNYPDCIFRNKVAESYIAYGFLDSAETLLSETIRESDLAECRHQATISLAMIDLKRENYSKAADKMKILLYSGDYLDQHHEEKAHYLLGNASFFLQQYQDAVAAYSIPLKSPRVAPENFSSVLRLGRSFAALGYYYNGIHTLNRYIRLIDESEIDEPESRELKENAMMFIADYLYKSQNYKAAINVLERVQDISRNDDIRFLAGITIGDILTVWGKSEMAVETYREIAEKGPYNFYGSLAISKMEDIKWNAANEQIINEFL